MSHRDIEEFDKQAGMSEIRVILGGARGLSEVDMPPFIWSSAWAGEERGYVDQLAVLRHNAAVAAAPGHDLSYGPRGWVLADKRQTEMRKENRLAYETAGRHVKELRFARRLLRIAGASTKRCCGTNARVFWTTWRGISSGVVEKNLAMI
ncbi:hypothetical protein OH76DRAFT_1418950 [Lentinus brumalis]|uniref:Uncharacterized protein n=1 Tax=Lentinus brumalis TaxID=2498619 RepID=A0A371D7C2_9APHY|nr:hypothetical protein OH76DRAFT_1418950 [Polyporus brumalis]